MSDASLLFKLALLKIIKLNDSNVLANLLKLYVVEKISAALVEIYASRAI